MPSTDFVYRHSPFKLKNRTKKTKERGRADVLAGIAEAVYRRPWYEWRNSVAMGGLRRWSLAWGVRNDIIINGCEE